MPTFHRSESGKARRQVSRNAAKHGLLIRHCHHYSRYQGGSNRIEALLDELVTVINQLAIVEDLLVRELVVVLEEPPVHSDVKEET